MVLEYLATKLGHLFFLNVGDSYSIHGAYGYIYIYTDAYLVGGLEHLLFSHVLGMSSSQLTHIFQRGFSSTTNHQPDMGYVNLPFLAGERPGTVSPARPEDDAISCYSVSA